MTATCTIATATDPITSANQAAVTATGTCTALDTVAVTIVDKLGAVVGPITATVAGTAWSIAATNVTALSDGTLIFQATATALDATKAFAAKAADKTTGLKLYITDSIFREAITDPSDDLNANKVARAIQSASRRVDEICDRSFGLATIVSPRVFKPATARLCIVDDFATTTGLIVKIDTNDDGAYDTTWAIATDFVPAPENQLHGGLPWAYDSIRATGNHCFPRPCRHKALEVTALWGWPSVPDAVVMATTLLAIRYYSRPDAPYGYQGFGDMGALPVRRDWDVEDLLSDYQKSDSQFLVA